MENQIRVNRLIKETEDTITIQFEKHPSLDRYCSGQFINIFKKDERHAVSRAYSFSSSPATDELPAVTVKRVAGGEMSGHLVDHLKEGEIITVSDPMGRFGLSADLDKKHLIFVAGGSGITPLFSMIKTALIISEHVQVSLIYANQTFESVIFREQLQHLADRYSSRFKITHFIEEKHNENDFSPCLTGRINQIELTKAISAVKGVMTEVYVCGPTAMMETISKYLDDVNFISEHRFFESFVGSNFSPTKKSKSSRKSREIVFLENNNTLKLRMDPDEFILQSALEHGHKLPHSCKEAMCGACKVKVVSGKVKMYENYALTDDQVDEGYVLICASKPESVRVTLTYS